MRNKKMLDYSHYRALLANYKALTLEEISLAMARFDGELKENFWETIKHNLYRDYALAAKYRIAEIGQKGGF